MFLQGLGVSRQYPEAGGDVAARLMQLRFFYTIFPEEGLHENCT